MADQEQSQNPKRAMGEKAQRDVAGKGGQTGGSKGHQTSGSQGQEREHGVQSGGSVGRDVPEGSFEKNTEIAVEAGRKGEHPDAKR
jgi:hypothetical protein